MTARGAVATIAVVSCALCSCARSAPSIRSVAVVVRGESPLAEGVAGRLIEALGRIHGLRVIAPGSVLRYHADGKTPAEITAELNVDGLITASVVRSGEHLDCALQLRQADRNTYIHAHPDIASVDSMVAGATQTFAEAMDFRLTADEKSGLSRARRTTPEAVSSYFQGLSRLQKGELEESIADLQQSIEKDSSYAPAHAALSMAYSGLSSVAAPPQNVMPLAKAAAVKALKLDDQLAEAHTALASVLLWYEYDWTGAERELKRALALNPSSADAHDLYGNYLNALQQYPEALATFEQASSLDPFSLKIASDYIYTLVTARHFDRAIEESRKAIAREPKFASAYAWMGMALAQQRQFPEAIAALRKANELDPNYTNQHLLAWTEAAAGDKTEARKLLARLEEQSRKGYVCAYEIGTVYSQLGEKDKAFAWLKRGRSEQADCIVWLKTEPWMDPLRTDPRYADLVKRIGFPDAAR